MKTLTDQLANYAAYHRDRRNIRTHFAGIPLIVIALAILFSRPTFSLDGWAISPTVLLVAVTSAYYLILDRPLGIVMTLLLCGAALLGAATATQETGFWLGSGIGLFVFGWVLQFIGHAYEGRKPAFVDDIMGLIIGPLFVVTELAFLAGLRGELQQAIEARVGPTH